MSRYASSILWRPLLDSVPASGLNVGVRPHAPLSKTSASASCMAECRPVITDAIFLVSAKTVSLPRLAELLDLARCMLFSQ